MSPVNVYGIGNPLIDIVTRVDDADLAALNLIKGIMRLVDLEERAKILGHIKTREIRYSCGGSCPNTLIFLSALGIQCALAGKIGGDEQGRMYAENIPQQDLRSQLIFAEGATGTSIILVSPDSERTMNTYLGVNRQFARSDIDDETVAGARYLYFTGYMWDTDNQKQAVLHAIDICKASGGSIVFDVADPFAVNRNREEFIALIDEHVDLVFANREEAELLFGAGSAEDIANKLSTLCNLAVVKNGTEGSIVQRRNNPPILLPICGGKGIDTTGAGDMYASGFLYGLCSGMSDRDAGICATFLASKIVAIYGAQFDSPTRKQIADEVKQEKWRFMT